MSVARALLIASVAVASATTLAATDKISAEDFVMKAGEAGAAEVNMGKLGAAKSTDKDVRAFAQHRVKDHTKANEELTAGQEDATHARRTSRGRPEAGSETGQVRTQRGDE